MPAPHLLETSAPGAWQFVEILNLLDLPPIVRSEVVIKTQYIPKVSSATVCCLFPESV